MVICSRRKDNVQSAVKQLHSAGLKDVIGVVCHVGTAEARKALVSDTLKAFGGRLDILVSNVACNPVMGSMTDATDEKAWDKVTTRRVAQPMAVLHSLSHMLCGGATRR